MGIVEVLMMEVQALNLIQGLLEVEQLVRILDGELGQEVEVVAEQIQEVLTPIWKGLVRI